MEARRYLPPLLAAVVLALGPARATTVIPPTFSELVGEAEIVIDGEVTAVRSELGAHEGNRLVFTTVTVEVLDVLKGSPGTSIELRLLGGTVGDFSMTVEGVPVFHRGDRSIFFIVGNGVQFCPLVAIMHGLYPIVPRPTDGVDIVLRTSGAPLAAPEDVGLPLAHGSGQASVQAAGAVAGGMTVAQFKARISEEVAHAHAK